MTQADQIAIVLRRGPLTVREIASATGLPRNVTRAILSRYAWRRWLKVPEGQRVGRWGLITPAPRDKET